MNCKDFESVIHEVVARRGAYPTRQSEALEHASRCLWCAVRLDEETKLTKNLQGFADALRAYQAPARVEEALLRIFREKASRAAANHKPVWLLLRHRLGWSMAFTATVTVAFVALLLAPRLSRHSKEPSPQAAQSSLLQSAAPANGQAIQPSAVQGRRTQSVALDKSAPEVATDWIPLGTCDDPECADEAVLVRMTLSSEALLMFGIPVDSDYPSGPLLADVVLGSDGVPYAIRFVD